MGTLWRKAGSFEYDADGERAGAAKAYFYVGGTGSTPFPVYQDAAETTPHTDPVVAAANGRWPAVYIPFATSYDEKITTSAGTQLTFYEEIPNPDPVEAVADAVDDDEVIQTGMVHWEPINTTKTGFVRLNGRTIGDASSGATERANADCADLFAYLWNNLANGQAAVSSGRGANAAADFAAHKTITLLDARGGTLRGLDDMGNSAASRLTAPTYTNGNATTAGSALGGNSQALTIANLPAVTPAGSISGTVTLTPTGTIAGTVTLTPAGSVGTTVGPTANNMLGVTSGSGAVTATAGAGVNVYTTNGGGYATLTASSNFVGTQQSPSISATFTGTQQSPSITATFTGTPFGSDTSHNNVSYGHLGTWFQKL